MTSKSVRYHFHSYTQHHFEKPEGSSSSREALSADPNPLTRQTSQLVSGLAPRKPLDLLGDVEQKMPTS